MTIVDDVRRSIMQVEAMGWRPTRVKMAPDLYRSMLAEIEEMQAYFAPNSSGADESLKLDGVEVIASETESAIEVESVRP